LLTATLLVLVGESAWGGWTGDLRPDYEGLGLLLFLLAFFFRWLPLVTAAMRVLAVVSLVARLGRVIFLIGRHI